MKVKKEQLCLYAITDRSWLNGRSLYEQVKEALDGGVTFLQLREKTLSEELFLKEAARPKPLCDSYHVPLIINDNVDIAQKVDAAGVHVGGADMDVSDVRKKLGEGKIIGASARTVEQAVLAESLGADYLGVGAVFGTQTKKDAKPVAWDVLRQICQSVSIPVVAIGGIDETNILELKGSGAAGVAVISAVFSKARITEAARELRKKAELL